MDALGEILAVARLGAAVVAQAELVAPWGLEIDPIAEAHLHVVQRGRCVLRLSGQRDFVALEAGDVVLIRGGVGHILCDDPKTRPETHTQVLARMPARVSALPAARRRETTVVLCAKYLFQQLAPHPLISLLPPLVHLPATQVAGHTQLSLLVQLLGSEVAAPGAGSQLVLPRLVDSLLVFVVRAFIDGQPLDASGWFAALRDPAIAKALSLMHAEPRTAWTVEGLSREVAQSRATFARRFAALVGEPPVAYLTRYRLCLASQLLAQTALSLDEIAARVGYDNASAFSRAFRRLYGDSPGRFRASGSPRTAGAERLA